MTNYQIDGLTGTAALNDERKQEHSDQYVSSPGQSLMHTRTWLRAAGAGDNKPELKVTLTLRTQSFS